MAVIDRTDCIFNKSIRRIQGVVLIWLIFRVIPIYSNPQGCEMVKKEIGAAGFPVVTVLDRPSTGPTCGEGSCCGDTLEQILFHQSKKQLDSFLKDTVSKVSSLLDVRAKKFDGIFRDMMNNSKREFHSMFQRTYGKAYLQNADVFSNFFEQLEQYYKKGSVRLSETLETFFSILYHRMFTVMNSQYHFDEKYLDCVSEHMLDLKPFGDLPNKLGMQLRRSFIATRTYYKALAEGASAAKKMTEIKLDEECNRQLMKMQYCGRCTGRQGAGACANYCTQTLSYCLRNHVAFSGQWNTFIDALDKVADRLIGPFNIEMVVEPLNIKISEAVMDFQDKGKVISRKIFELCGQPKLNRRRRAANINDDVEDNPNYEIKFETMKLHNSNKKKKNKKVDVEDLVPSLEKLIKEIKTRVRETRQFWSQLVYQYCNNDTIAASPSVKGNCWNGTAISDYTRTLKIQTQKLNPIVNEQIFALQVFTDKLRKAHQGDEVEIIDDSEDSLENSGGSGSGSGEGPIEEDDDDHTGDDDSDDIINGRSNAVVPEVVPKVESEVPTSTREPDQDNREEEEQRNRDQQHSSANTISLSKALAQYLLPIVLVWFGGAIADIL